ncbi:MAG: flagellar motor switch phosphatase FliY [Peptococcaceae bacterium]|jgi:flagellar motor switch protein FliN/FliY|nr:flagellar motor switch phosphatase FliY [Peptococcaceae bacterium]
MLTQEEINALLSKQDADQPSAEAETAEEQPSEVTDIGTELPLSSELNDLEQDVLREIANISMGTAATTLSALLGKKIEITTPQLSLTDFDHLKDSYKEPYIVVDVTYKEGLIGSNALVINVHDAGVIVDLMMGGDGTNPPLDLTEMHISALSEAMNQMMGSSSTSLAQILGKKIDISTPMPELSGIQEQEQLDNDDVIVKISFSVVIQDLLDSQMMQLMPLPFAKMLAEELLSSNASPEPEPAPVQENPPQSAPAADQFAAPPPGQAPQEAGFGAPYPYPPQGYYPPPPYPYPPGQAQTQQIPVTPLTFQSLSTSTGALALPANIGLLMDVDLQLSVELGRTYKKIRDVLDFTTGSVIELDKLAGEPADILVNGKLLAKGEVVVIDENFGVRVTEIVSPEERLKYISR